MAYEVCVGDKYRIEDRLNGGARLGPFPSSGLPIGGLTLIFAVPAVTVTFTGALGEVRTWAQILADLVAQAPTVTSKTRPANNGPAGSGSAPGVVPSNQVELRLYLDTGITIDKDGTANTLLRIPTAADTVYPVAVAQTKIVGFTQGLAPTAYAVLINLS
jgi:hypothetical protein